MLDLQFVSNSRFRAAPADYENNDIWGALATFTWGKREIRKYEWPEYKIQNPITDAFGSILERMNMFLISDLFQWVGRKALLTHTTNEKGGNVQKSQKTSDGLVICNSLDIQQCAARRSSWR